jgi:hypothetical protein
MLGELRVKDAWQYSNEKTRIHYIISTVDGGTRRLYADKGNALYLVLRDWMLANDKKVYDIAPALGVS